MSVQILPFVGFNKISRLARACIVTEKVDGTNGQIHVLESGQVLAASRNRYLAVEDDNFGFAKWVAEHEEELRGLGPGRHFGEWYGRGIQRGYGLADRRFALFNVSKWNESRPACCGVVPVLYRGTFDTGLIEMLLVKLKQMGSVLVPGFKTPEGIVVYHEDSGSLFKKTLEGDEKPKGMQHVPMA